MKRGWILALAAAVLFPAFSAVTATAGEKDFIEKRSKMSYQEVVDVWLGTDNDVQEMNAKLEKLTDHNDIPRIAAAGLG